MKNLLWTLLLLPMLLQAAPPVERNQFSTNTVANSQTFTPYRVGGITATGTVTSKKLMVDFSPGGPAVMSTTNIVEVIGANSNKVFEVNTNGLTVHSRTNINTATADGLWIRNTTAAAAGAQQYSPALHLQGQGWKTDATAASQSVDLFEVFQPVQGAAEPTANLLWQIGIGGAAPATKMTLNSVGALGVGMAAGPANSVSVLGTFYGGNNSYIGQSGMNVPATGWMSWEGRSYFLCFQDSNISMFNAAGNSFNMLQFGNTGSTHPGLKRNGVNLDVRLADDTDGAGLIALTLRATNSVAVGGTNGVVQMFDATGSNFVRLAASQTMPALSNYTFRLPPNSSNSVMSGMYVTNSGTFGTNVQARFNYLWFTNVTLDFPTILANSSTNLTFDCLGAVTNAAAVSIVTVNPSVQSTWTNRVMYVGVITNLANVATCIIQACNFSAASINPPSGVFSVKVEQFQ